MAALKPVKVGLIGCGSIASHSYMPTILKQYSFIDVVKCADTVPERAKMFEEKFGCKAVTNEEIYNDPEIEIVLNLTYPESHYEVTKAALEHGKSVHSEKMMGVTWEEGLELAKLAAECEKKGIWYTQAPDTFLGGAWQTARKLLDDGAIGTPIAAYCFISRGSMILGGDRGKSTRRQLPPQQNAGAGGRGFGGFTPLPGYNPRGPKGSGLPYDMGGYYLHNMINLLGNINRVSGYYTTMAKTHTSNDPLNELYKGTKENHEPDTIVGSMEFENGAYGSIVFASGINDGVPTQFYVYGSEGTLVLPDPNFFAGKVQIQAARGVQVGYNFATGVEPYPMWELPMTHGYLEEARGVGVVDLAFAIRNGRRPRCHYSMGFQAFEVVNGIFDSADNGVQHKMVSKTERPAAVKPGILRGNDMQTRLDD